MRISLGSITDVLEKPIACRQRKLVAKTGEFLIFMPYEENDYRTQVRHGR